MLTSKLGGKNDWHQLMFKNQTIQIVIDFMTKLETLRVDRLALANIENWSIRSLLKFMSWFLGERMGLFHDGISGIQYSNHLFVFDVINELRKRETFLKTLC